jgi:transcriptional regulator with XRE-family HTH domain
MKREEVCKLFGEILARRRSEARLSQKAFAEAIGLSRTSVTNIERGRQPVNLHTLYIMADVLRRDVNDLLPPSPNKGVESSLNVPLRRKQSSRGSVQLNQLSSKEFNWLNNIAKAKPQRSNPHARN